MSSEKTAAAAGTVGQVRRDHSRCFHFAATTSVIISHWLDIGDHPGANLRSLLRKLVPQKMREFHLARIRRKCGGFKMVLERIGGTTEAVETAIGMVPKPEDLDVSDLILAGGAPNPIGCK